MTTERTQGSGIKKRTSNLEEQVCKLQGKTIRKGHSSWKNATAVSSGQLARQSRKADLTYDPLEGIHVHQQ